MDHLAAWRRAANTSPGTYAWSTSYADVFQLRVSGRIERRIGEPILSSPGIYQGLRVPWMERKERLESTCNMDVKLAGLYKSSGGRVMLTTGYHVASELMAPGIKLEIRTYPTIPLTGVIRSNDHNLLGLVVNGPPGAMIRQYDVRGDLEEIGMIGFQPRHVPWEFHASRGAWTSVICEYEDDDMFDRIVGPRSSWNRRACEASCNVRSSEVLQLLLLLERELRAPGFASSLVTETLATAALHYLARYVHPNEDTKPHGTYVLTRAQLRMIDERLKDLAGVLPTVAELASLCGMSGRHLLRKFKHTTGRTISDYVAESQLAKAKYLLSQTDRPLKAIAHELGFGSQSSFGTAFRKAVCESPSQFRRLMHGSANTANQSR